MSHRSVRMNIHQTTGARPAQANLCKASAAEKVAVVSSSADAMTRIRSYVRAGVLPQCKYFAFEETFGRNVRTKPEHEGVQVIDFMENEVVAAEIREFVNRFRVDRVVAVDEFSVCIAAALREEARCCGASPGTARRVRDKLLMKQLVAEAGIAIPRQYAREDLERGNISFPVVVKPRSLAGSVGVVVLRSLEQIDLASLTMATSAVEYSDMSEKQLHVEEFVDGDLFHLDGLVRTQKAIFVTASRYIGTPLGYLGGKPVASTTVSAVECSEWQPFVDRCLDALGVPDGAFHLEAFIRPSGERVFLELAARPGGGPIRRTIELAQGVDLLLEHLRLQLGLDTTFETANLPVRCGGWVIFPKAHSEPHGHHVTHVMLPPRKRLSTVVEIAAPDVGADASGPFFCHEDNLGQFILIGGSEDVLNDVNFILKHYAVEYSR